MNPYFIIAGLIAWGLSVAGAGWYGIEYGIDRQIAHEKKTDDLVRQVQDATALAAAEAIAKIKPRNTTIQQETRHEIETHTVYRDCHVTADGLRMANEALTGRAQPAAGGQLPAAGTPVGRLDGGAAGQAGGSVQPVP